MRGAGLASIAIAFGITACSLIVNTDGYVGGGERSDASSPDAIAPSGDAGDAGTSTVDGGGDAGKTPLLDTGWTGPVSTSTVGTSPTTPSFTTSASCTDLIVLANSGINAGNTASATISTSSGVTFAEVTKDSGHNADTVYIWKATNACASRSGTVTVTWSLSGGSVLWSNVAVFAFTHSKGIGAATAAHNPGNNSINTIAITPMANGSWLFATLTGNNSQNADTSGTAGNFVQQWSVEGAIHSYGTSATPSPSTAGAPVTFSLTSADSIWASAAAEVLTL